ncbi:MAG: hypothetical protein ACOYMF_17425, partial [Bacteroidales bacterium]
MERFNNLVCISGPEIIGSICTEANYKQLTQRGHLHVVRRGCNGTPALIEYDSIPERFKAEIVRLYGDPHKVVTKYGIRAHLKPDYEALEYFAGYILPDGRHLPIEPVNKQEEYAANAMVLNALGHIVNDRTALRKALGGSTRNVWVNLTESVRLLKSDVKHTLPDNPVRLKQKLEQYRKDGYICLISGKWLNRNANKVDDPEQEGTMRQLLRKHTNLDNEQIRMIYNLMAEKLGWDSITAGTVANYRAKWELQTHSGRRGENSFDNTRAMLVKRTAPVSPLYYWTMDGWDVELLYQATEIVAKGNSRTTYHNRLTVVVILDPCNKYPVGFAIGTQETPSLIKAAMRNAVNHTRELFGDRHKVLQLQTDNYGRKTLLPIYEAISEKYTPARVHNAKAKVIEPYFGRLNKKYCQLMTNWSGFGITSGSSRQPNAEYLNKIRHSFPDEMGCRMQIERIIEMERAAAREKYLAAYAEMPVEDKKLLSDEEYLFMFGDVTGYTNRLSASGLVVTICDRKHEYDTYDVTFRQHAQVDWTVKYDPDQPGQVLAVSADSSHRYMLTEKYVQPMALRDRKPGDAEQLHQINQFNKSIKARITEGMAEDATTVNELFAHSPQLQDTLAKLVLCDSNGQHKDNRNAARLKGATKLLAKQNKATERQDNSDWEALQKEYLSAKVDI